MTEVIRAAADLQSFCESQHWRFSFIGGLAVQRWGEPRETVDVDLTLLTGFSNEGSFVSALLGQFEPRIEQAAQFAAANRVLLLRGRSGVDSTSRWAGCPLKRPSWSVRACSPSLRRRRYAPVRQKT